jgi:thiosulfate/3-mercaptopyruvate sulfurtransferase
MDGTDGNDRPEGFAHQEYLVGTDWLAAHHRDPGVRVLDVTARLTASLDNVAHDRCFVEGHIPGSVSFDSPSAKGALSDPDAELPWMWPSPERVEASLRAAGVNDGDRVIITARTPRAGLDSGTMWCTRAWWTLHHMGVDVAIHHGGVEAWESAGLPIETGPSTVSPGSISVSRDGLGARATVADVLAALEDADACVVDALSAANYAGVDPGYGPRRGHITGARNLPYQSLISAETAAFLGAPEMRAAFDALGLLERPRVVTYCGGAIAATVVAFCLALFDHRDVAVYDGSLMEWSRDPSLPMTDPSA